MAKRVLQDIWTARNQEGALAAFDALVETWGIKHDQSSLSFMD